ncbi:MAG: sulfite exporter TauE/SafE family protein [Phycisphaerales bacterium]|nr:sulfite exporter TauE/SafE family protein [Phycisphaerales bacterium]
MPFGLWDVIELLLLGWAAGIIGGLMGVGGGILMIPALVLFLGERYGVNSFHVYRLAAITASVALSIIAALRHLRERAVIVGLLRGIIPFAFGGIVLGVILSMQFVGPHTATLRQIFGGFLFLVAGTNLYQQWRAHPSERHVQKSCPMPKRWVRIGVTIGLPAGFIAGLLAVGGGVWAVPAQRQLLGIRIRNAIATSSVMIVFISIVTSVLLAYSMTRLPETERIDPRLGLGIAAVLAPGAILGGWLGAGLTHRMPVDWLRFLFHLTLGVFGIRLAFFP